MFRRVRSRDRQPVAPVGTYTTWWWPPAPSGFTRLAWDLEPRTDPSPVGYFWSHQVAFVGGQAAYFGLQTNGSAPTGKIAIFSVWGALAADGPEHAGPFGGEGSGMTVRIRHEWVPGRPERLSLAAEGDGWWRAEVSGRPVGRVRVDPAWGGIAPQTVMWTERYAPPLRRCADLGHAVALFGEPLADADVRPLGHRNHLAPNPGCPGSSVTDVPGGVLHVMGAPTP
jgi:hypothetical protein